MGQYLIDTNIVSDFLSDSLPQKGMLFIDSVVNAVPNISVITQIEVLCWDTDEMTIDLINSFINDCNIYNIDKQIIKDCVSIRKGNKIKTPDAIIAATALANNQTLITNNEKDFKNIRGLQLVNPHKL